MTITIADGRGALWQWDTGRRVKVDGGVEQVHYQNRCFGTTIDVDVGTDGTAIIPDELLQDWHPITVYAYTTDDTGGYTEVQQVLPVHKRAKPADYVYTPTEQKTLADMQQQIGDLSELETEAKDNLVAAINEAAASGGSGGTSDHSKLKNRDAADQHPMGAITGLLEALDGKQPTGDYLTADTLQSATDAALTQAKASGAFDGAPGKDGTNGITPIIGDNGNWYLGDTDTGKPSRGAKGDKGDTGAGMDVTGATVGQIAKITAVDTDGKPTAWEPVDMPSGEDKEEWEIVFTDVVAEDACTYTRNVDTNGEAFQLDEAVLVVLTVPFAESKNDCGRAVAMVPTAYWGYATLAPLTNTLAAGTSSVARYDVIHVKVINGYQIVLNRSISQNSSSVFGQMMPATDAASSLGAQFYTDKTKYMQINRAQGDITCVKILGYTDPNISAGSIIRLYKRKGA